MKRINWGEVFCPVQPRRSWWGKLLSRFWQRRVSQQAQSHKPWRSGGVEDRSYVSECFWHANSTAAHSMGFTMTYEEWEWQVEAENLQAEQTKM